MQWVARARLGGAQRRSRWLGMSISPCHISRFSPEFQLACCCCRTPLAEQDWDEIQSLVARVDVPAFLDLVISRHRIGPLVYAVMKQLPAQTLPPGLMAPLSACSRANSVAALQSKRAHILLARWFSNAGIDWLPFKGVTVAQRYYGDFALRQVNDIDIWVPASKMLGARALLLARGFQAHDSTHHWALATRGPRHLDYLTRYYFEEQLYSREFGCLELHWQLTANTRQFSVKPETILSQSDQIKLGDTSVGVMNHVDLLLYLCEHGARHGWYRLKWLADLPRLLAYQNWDWRLVFDRALEAGSARSLLLGLALSRDLFGCELPEAVHQELRAFVPLSIAIRTVRLDLQAPSNQFVPVVRPSIARRFADLLRSLVLSSNFRGAGMNVWRYSLSPNDLQVIKLPDRWFWLYYVLRPILFTIRIWRA